MIAPEQQHQPNASIAVCMKWVALRPDIDPISGAVSTDERWSGPSLADQAALELALRIGASRNTQVIVLTVGDSTSDAMLTEALACGATSAIRIAHATTAKDHAPSSASVAAALGEVLRPLCPQLVLCGDWSLDRGSGSVPPFLAAELDYGQACGIVDVKVNVRASFEGAPSSNASSEIATSQTAPSDAPLLPVATPPHTTPFEVATPSDAPLLPIATPSHTAPFEVATPSDAPLLPIATPSHTALLQVDRRLDGGRREALTITGPAVLSVEGVAARLRRANLAGVMAAQKTPIEVRTTTKLVASTPPVRTGPFRPRARILDAPSSLEPRQRLEVLTGAFTNRTPPVRVTLDPEDAADLILSTLAEWGYDLPTP